MSDVNSDSQQNAGNQQATRTNMRGILFRNKKKNEAKQPDFYGDAKIDGETYVVSAWINESAGGKHISMSYRLDDRSERSEPVPEDDDILSTDF